MRKCCQGNLQKSYKPDLSQDKIMRWSTLINIVFINLAVIGIVGYFYMIWMQYWAAPPQPDMTTISIYDQSIYLYNRGYLVNRSEEILKRSKHHATNSANAIRPRFPSGNPHKVLPDTREFLCRSNDTEESCSNKTLNFKQIILTHLSNSLHDEGNSLKQGNNTYNVHYAGSRENYKSKLPKQLLCELLNIKFKTIKKADVDSLNHLRSAMPKREFFENKFYNSCVVVASSGALKHSKLGPFIDSHDVVLRFNSAPTEHYTEDVGSKTSVRVLNSQVVTKPKFHFLKSSLYKNITLVVWDPSNYSATLEEWLKQPERNLFPNFIQYRRQEAKPRIYMLNPTTLWNVWDFLQRNTLGRLRKNPPSSGFLGLRLLLPHCSFVDVVEYVPSARVSSRCHYFDSTENSGCTFGSWHPLAAEKLMTYHLNEATDQEVFQKGFLRVRGFKDLKC